MVAEEARGAENQLLLAPTTTVADRFNQRASAADRLAPGALSSAAAKQIALMILVS